MGERVIAEKLNPSFNFSFYRFRLSKNVRKFLIVKYNEILIIFSFLSEIFEMFFKKNENLLQRRNLRVKLCPGTDYEQPRSPKELMCALFEKVQHLRESEI